MAFFKDRTYSLSPSSLALFKECKRCFWLHINKRFKRPTSAFPSLPSGIDKLIKEHFNYHLESGTRPKELSFLSEKINLFSNKEILKKWMANIEWQDEEGNKLNGKIDYLLEDEEKRAIIIDFKTKGSYVNENDVKNIEIFYKPQLEIYAYLVMKNGFYVNNYGYLLYFYPKSINEDGSFVFGIEGKKVMLDIMQAEALFKDAIETLRGPLPESSKTCDFCSWADKRAYFI
ncbi:MAG: PD-(D/E)XK nuclease family protein [Candidatus Anstonellales archaeon]